MWITCRYCAAAQVGQGKQRHLGALASQSLHKAAEKQGRCNDSMLSCLQTLKTALPWHSLSTFPLYNLRRCASALHLTCALTTQLAAVKRSLR